MNSIKISCTKMHFPFAVSRALCGYINNPMPTFFIERKAPVCMSKVRHLETSWKSKSSFIFTLRNASLQRLKNLRWISEDIALTPVASIFITFKINLSAKFVNVVGAPLSKSERLNLTKCILLHKSIQWLRMYFTITSGLSDPFNNRSSSLQSSSTLLGARRQAKLPL